MNKRSGRNSNSSGFSLIEMLVAMVILGLSLGVLYQASAGAVRNVRLDERYSYAVQIAQSLLEDHRQLPSGGVSLSGTAGDDYQWDLNSTPVSADGALPEPALYQLDVVVRWEGDGSREVALTTIAPEITVADVPMDAPVESLND